MDFLFRLHGRPRAGHSRGQAVAEFALISVVLLAMFATVLDLGRVFYAQITLANAARAGALQGAITPDSFNTGACNTVSNRIGCAVMNESRGSLVTVTGSQINVTCVDGNGTPQTCPASPQLGWRTKVDVTGTFTLLMPVLQFLFGGSTIHLDSAVASDQQSLPPPSTALPSSSPLPTASPSPSPSPSLSPSPSPSPMPCASGQAPVPDLVNSNGGGPETVSQARAEWLVPGFTGQFNPTNGQNSKTVVQQYADANHNTVLTPGVCQPLSTAVYVTYQ